MMRLPVHLQQLISAAREQVLHHPEHHLLPVNRLPIYAALEPAAGQDVRIQLVRGRLAIATARYVFPIWQQALPIMGDTKPAIDWRDWVQRYPLTDALPEWMLQQAEAVLHDTVDIETVCEDSGDLWYVLSNFYDEIVEGYTDAPEEAWFACKAAYQALSEVTGGLEPLEIDPSLPPPVTDDDVENLDGAGAAMHAFAGVGLADPGRATRRRTFWEWWLMEAIPAAWDATQVPEFNG